MEKLRKYLATLPNGKITDRDQIAKVEELLAEEWPELEGNWTKMAGYKIPGRTEEMEWKSPLLYFKIERHGLTMLGSKKAELQEWEVDVNQGETSCLQTKYRQKYKRSPPLKTKPLAEKVGKLIVKCQDNKKLKWYDNKTTVRVIIGEIIPDDMAKETVAGRRKRFRRDLTEYLKSYGWAQVRPNKYTLLKKP